MSTNDAARRLARDILPLLAAACSLSGCGRTRPEATTPEYVADVDAWHAGRLERLRDENGWLTLVGLHELDPTRVNTVGSDEAASVRLVDQAPARVGELACLDRRWTFAAAPEAAITVADSTEAAIDATVMLTDQPGPPTTLACGTLRFFVIERDGRFFLRVKDRDAAVRRDFAGIERYPVDARWRVTAHLEKGPATVPVPNVLGQESQEPSPGILVFRLGGRRCRLTPTGGPGEELFLVFGDATNGRGTYPGGRFLSAPAPAADGTVVLDFNRAYNPPCVFTPYATCPLPGQANTLEIPVEAGEKAWGEHR